MIHSTPPDAADRRSSRPAAVVAAAAVGVELQATALLALVLVAASCGGRDAPPDRLPDRSRLIQKQDYQALYGPTGRIERLLHDGDHDGIAEAVVVYTPQGKPERGEIDTNGDHIVDRWELLRPDGTVMSVGTSRRGSLTPDTWEHVDPEGRVYQRDFDDDGDGTADRTKYPDQRESRP
jgi:hypothetical protein